MSRYSVIVSFQISSSFRWFWESERTVEKRETLEVDSETPDVNHLAFASIFKLYSEGQLSSMKVVSVTEIPLKTYVVVCSGGTRSLVFYVVAVRTYSEDSAREMAQERFGFVHKGSCRITNVVCLSDNSDSIVDIVSRETHF
jgi:hypothetical protein